MVSDLANCKISDQSSNKSTAPIEYHLHNLVRCYGCM